MRTAAGFAALLCPARSCEGPILQGEGACSDRLSNDGLWAPEGLVRGGYRIAGEALAIRGSHVTATFKGPALVGQAAIFATEVCFDSGGSY